MNSNRKLLVYGASCAVVLVVAIAIFFIKLFSGTGGGAGEEYYSNVNLCKAVPSDAVLLLDIKELEGINTIVGDTSSFSYGFVDKTNALASMQQRMVIVSRTGGSSGVEVRKEGNLLRNSHKFVHSTELCLDTVKTVTTVW